MESGIRDRQNNISRVVKQYTLTVLQAQWEGNGYVATYDIRPNVFIFYIVVCYGLAIEMHACMQG